MINEPVTSYITEKILRDCEGMVMSSGEMVTTASRASLKQKCMHVRVGESKGGDG